MRRRSLVCAAILVSTLLIRDALAQCPIFPCATCPQFKCGGQVNISGAAFLEQFVESPRSTVDSLDADCDGLFGPFSCDQLAPGFTVPGWSGWWLVQFRSVGSREGLNELADFRCAGSIPTSVPVRGYINRARYADSGLPIFLFPCCDAPAACCGSGTPVCPTSIDIAALETPSFWAVSVPGGPPQFNRGPLQMAYGTNGLATYDASASNAMPPIPGCVNFNTASPDGDTVFDFGPAWIPYAIIAGRGVDRCTLSMSELRFLFATGRLPNGENLVASTRDNNAGVRFGAMNSLCLDPSFGRGDNVGGGSLSTAASRLGPSFEPAHKLSAAALELVVQNHRLAVGYTALYGSGRAADDAAAQNYDLLNVVNDLALGTLPVAPTPITVLDNCNPDDGWRIGGQLSLATIGNPFGAPAMANDTAADYIRNIQAAVAGFGGACGDCTLTGLSASGWIIDAAVECLPDPLTPCTFLPNPIFNPAIRTCLTLPAAPACGTLGVANRVPQRVANPIWSTAQRYDCCGPYPSDGFYSDGSTSGAYRNYWTGVYSVNGGSLLNARNAVMGDFNDDGDRNALDIPDMLAALNSPLVWVTSSGKGGTAADPAVPEILGDFNGDGNFDCRDVRYFCDGLAIDISGRVDRGLAFFLVDSAWSSIAADNNFFNTVLIDNSGSPINNPVAPADPLWVVGASAADVAGGTPWPGAQPHGADCRVDCTDYQYVQDNVGNWTDLAQAVSIDLSCDMGGDLAINAIDLLYVQGLIGGPCRIACCLNAGAQCVTISPASCIAIGGSPAPDDTCLGDLNGNGLDDACEPNTVKWIQPPDLGPTGIDLYDMFPLALADDFRCTQKSRITEVIVWASWRGDDLPPGGPLGIEDLCLAIYADDPGPPFSEPGVVLWALRNDPNNISVAVERAGIAEGWLDPSTGPYIFPGDTVCYRYTIKIQLGDAFCQEGSPSAPIDYWFSAQVEPVVGDPELWGWKTTPQPRQWNDPAVWSVAPLGFPSNGPWTQLTYPLGGHPFATAPLDLAFAFGVGRPCRCPGDMNCDGFIDFQDIDPFVLALQGKAAYLAQYPDCDWLHGDIDGLNGVNFADIDPFVALIGTPCP